MLVLMVGQEVLGRAGDERAQQTFLGAEPVLHECRRLQLHLTAQDKGIATVCAHNRRRRPPGPPRRVGRYHRLGPVQNVPQDGFADGVGSRSEALSIPKITSLATSASRRL